MRRVAASLLIAYAATITVVAAWLGCRVYVLERACTIWLWAKPGGLPAKSYDEIQEFTGIAQRMTDTVDAAAIGLANLHPGQIAAVAGLAFLGCYAFAAVRRPARISPAPTSPKD